MTKEISGSVNDSSDLPAENSKNNQNANHPQMTAMLAYMEAAGDAAYHIHANHLAEPPAEVAKACRLAEAKAMLDWLEAAMDKTPLANLISTTNVSLELSWADGARSQRRADLAILRAVRRAELEDMG